MAILNTSYSGPSMGYKPAAQQENTFYSGPPRMTSQVAPGASSWSGPVIPQGGWWGGTQTTAQAAPPWAPWMSGGQPGSSPWQPQASPQPGAQPAASPAAQPFPGLPPPSTPGLLGVQKSGPLPGGFRYGAGLSAPSSAPINQGAMGGDFWLSRGFGPQAEQHGGMGNTGFRTGGFGFPTGGY